MLRVLKRLFAFILVCSPIAKGYGADTGKEAVMKYFAPGRSGQSMIVNREPASLPGNDNLIALSVSGLFNSKSYGWTEESLKGWGVEASYQSPMASFFTRGFHLEYQKYITDRAELGKVSLLMSFTFPRRLDFPVFLAIAAGPGYFTKQKANESEFTIDYKGYAGLRFTQQNTQYFLQSGVKNHVHMLSDGQFISWYFSSGVAYKF